jgi:NAD(P)-dependent dehydrogenase (short-subunit alcohol dehydrogenase family)
MFKNNKIIITGASRGVGFEAAKLLLTQGATILGIGQDEQRMAKAQEELKNLGEFHNMICDISQLKAAEWMLNWVNQKWGYADALVNNAGVLFYVKDNEEEDPLLLEKTLRINLLGPHQLIKVLLPCLKKAKEPKVVNVASGAGTRQALQTETDMLSYRMSKYALNGLTMLWANTLKGKVAVNSLDPGWLKTDMGGPNAPGDPVEGGQRVVDVLSKSFTETGKFWHGPDEIAF